MLGKIQNSSERPHHSAGGSPLAPAALCLSCPAALAALETATPTDYRKASAALRADHRLIFALDLRTATCPRWAFKGDLDLMHLLAVNKLLPQILEKGPSVNMLAALKEVEALLPQLLAERDRWRSLLIDYRPPHLMRLYCDLASVQLGGKSVRVNLHYFLQGGAEDHGYEAEASKESGENLYHPHGWASCMRILNGAYDQYIGFADRPGVDALPRKLCRLTHSAGDSYAMTHPWLSHQVTPRPQEAVSTLMVTHIPEHWDQEVPQATKRLRALNDKELDMMFEHFSDLFPQNG